MDPKQSIDALQYQVVASRRQATDTMMWQVPTVSLTAQAFLFTIALAPNATRAAQLVSAGLALIASITSIQLMAKHRFHELADSKWLEEFERQRESQGYQIIHAVRPRSKGGGPWIRFVRVSSYKIWLFALSSFAIAALLILLFPNWFDP
jgi:hypothetical protein